MPFLSASVKLLSAGGVFLSFPRCVFNRMFFFLFSQLNSKKAALRGPHALNIYTHINIEIDIHIYS